MWRLRDHATAATYAIIAAVLAAAVTALYWSIINGQGDQGQRRPQLVAISLLAAAGLLVLSSVTPGRVVRLLMLSASSSMLVIWAVLGAFSIGVFLLPAAVFGLIAAGRASDLVPTASAWLSVATGAAGALTLTLVVLRVS